MKYKILASNETLDVGLLQFIDCLTEQIVNSFYTVCLLYAGNTIWPSSTIFSVKMYSDGLVSFVRQTFEVDTMFNSIRKPRCYLRRVLFDARAESSNLAQGLIVHGVSFIATE